MKLILSFGGGRKDFSPFYFCYSIPRTPENRGNFGDSVAPLFPDRFQGGIIIAVDSRASMGSYIGSQTVKKAGSLDSSARRLTKMEIYEIHTTSNYSD